MNERKDHYLDYLNGRITFCEFYLQNCATLSSETRARLAEHKADTEQKRAEYLAAKRKECHG